MLERYEQTELSERYRLMEPELHEMLKQKLQAVYAVMKEKKLTIKELADRIQMDRTMLWRVINGERSMKVNDVPTMSKLLGVTANEFFFDKKKAVCITPDADVFVDAYKRLNDTQRAQIDKELDERSKAIGERLEKERAYIEEAMYKRFKKFCDANMIAYEDMIDKGENNMVKSAAARAFKAGRFAVKPEFLMYCSLILDISADYFIMRDYTGAGVYRIGVDGKKEPLTAEETGILKKFLLAEEDAQILGKSMAMAIMD